MRRSFVLGCLLLCLVGCARSHTPGSGQPGLAVQMRYMPKDALELGSLSWLKPGMVVAVHPLVDARPDSTRIGENRQDETAVPITDARPGQTAAVVDEAVRRELSGLGLRVTLAGTPAERQLRFTLLRLWVMEDNTYNGEVRLSVEVFGPDNQAPTTVLAGAEAKNFGSSLSEVNYCETWSTALTRALGQLIHDPAFGKAMSSG